MGLGPWTALSPVQSFSHLAILLIKDYVGLLTHTPDPTVDPGQLLCHPRAAASETPGVGVWLCAGDYGGMAGMWGTTAGEDRDCVCRKRTQHGDTEN